MLYLTGNELFPAFFDNLMEFLDPTALQSQNAVTAYLKSKQLPHFDFAPHRGEWCGCFSALFDSGLKSRKNSRPLFDHRSPVTPITLPDELKTRRDGIVYNNRAHN